MPPPDPLTPEPSLQAEPVPWSESDFAPIGAFYRDRLGMTFESHRLGLIRVRLRMRLMARAYPSFTRFHDRLLKVDPTGPAIRLLSDVTVVNETAGGGI